MQSSSYGFRKGGYIFKILYDHNQKEVATLVQKLARDTKEEFLEIVQLIKEKNHSLVSLLPSNYPIGSYTITVDLTKVEKDLLEKIKGMVAGRSEVDQKKKQEFKLMFEEMKRKKLKLEKKKQSFLFDNNIYFRRLLESPDPGMNVSGVLTVLDTLYEIFEFLDPIELYKISFVCKFWMKIILGIDSRSRTLVKRLNFKELFRKYRYNPNKKRDTYINLISKFGANLKEISCDWCIYIPSPAFKITGTVCNCLEKINFKHCSLDQEFFKNFENSTSTKTLKVLDFENQHEIDPKDLFAKLEVAETVRYTSDECDIPTEKVDDNTIKALANCHTLKEIMFNAVTSRVGDLAWKELIKNNKNLEVIEIKYDMYWLEDMTLESDGLNRTVEEILKLKNIKLIKLDKKLTTSKLRRECYKKCKSVFVV